MEFEQHYVGMTATRKSGQVVLWSPGTKFGAAFRVSKSKRKQFEAWLLDNYGSAYEISGKFPDYVLGNPQVEKI